MAPGSSRIASPGWAASSAACRLAPACTITVAPDGGTRVVSTCTRGSSGLAAAATTATDKASPPMGFTST